MSEDAAALTFELPTRPGAAGAARRALSALNGNLHLVTESTLRNLQLAATEFLANAQKNAVPRGPDE